jgi:hypothetical protein
MELCDESPDYMPTGFTDVWKGNYHGEPVCIKAIRTLDLYHLKKTKRVCGSFILPKVYSAGFMPDLPWGDQQARAHFPPKHTSHHRGFGDTVSVLHRKSVDARREHHPVHQGESKCRSADAGTSQST